MKFYHVSLRKIRKRSLWGFELQFYAKSKMLWGSKQLKDILRSMHFVQRIVKPSRMTQNSSTLIDINASMHPQNIPLSGVIPLGLSDHNMVGCVRKINSLKLQSRTATCRNYSTYNAEIFNVDLKNISWDHVINAPNVNCSCE